MATDPAMGGESMQPSEAQLPRLLELPLFGGLSGPPLEALKFEVRLGSNPKELPPDVPPRASYVRFERLQAGSVLLSQGDLSTDLRIILDGVATAARTDPRRRATELFTVYERGDWFGEASALSHLPAPATVTAQTDVEAAAIDARLFRKLYADDREQEGPFARRIDEHYQKKSLPLHLKVSPLLAGSDERELEALAAEAELVPKPAETRIAAAGTEARDFYLVRSGAVKCSRDVDGRERVLAYYLGNSSFGEQAVATADRNWPANYDTLTPVDLIRIPRASFERLRDRSPDAFRQLTRRANTIVSERDLGALYVGGGAGEVEDALAADEVEVMVHRQAVKGGQALVIDKVKCVHCNACVESCAAVHGDGINRLSRVGATIASGEVLITACYNCAEPECMARCNYGAIRRDARGMVRFVYDNCVGCTECTKGCPYGVIRMTEPRREDPGSLRPRPLLGLLASVPMLGLLFRQRTSEPAKDLRVMSIGGEVTQVAGKAIKCDSCAGLPFEACVYNCPTGAIVRRNPEGLFQR